MASRYLTARQTQRTRRIRWLAITLAGLIGLIGYYGPWVPHKVAGLVVIGLDLAEYVKFIPEFASGKITFRREIFYLPLFAASLGASLLASRRVLPTWSRWLIAVLAIPLALAILPPAWSPGILLQAEFRLQTLAIVFCLLLVLGHAAPPRRARPTDPDSHRAVESGGRHRAGLGLCPGSRGNRGALPSAAGARLGLLGRHGRLLGSSIHR